MHSNATARYNVQHSIGIWGAQLSGEFKTNWFLSKSKSIRCVIYTVLWMVYNISQSKFTRIQRSPVNVSHDPSTYITTELLACISNVLNFSDRLKMVVRTLHISQKQLELLPRLLRHKWMRFFLVILKWVYIDLMLFYPSF